MASSDKKWELNCDDFKCIEAPTIGELGGGEHSVVRLTFHTTLGPVAVKCFSVTGGPPDRRRLENKIARELEFIQKAANEFIVQTHGWVKWHKAMGLVMEYLPVGSIRQFTVNSIAKLTPKIILRMAHEIASAIAYMHNPLGNHRVVHGDLKPENVLLTKELHCKVGDFGSAELAALTGDATLTGPKREKPGMTLAYASPEKLKKTNIKPKKEQDTYSFGMLLYVLLTGSAPYTQTYQESRFLDSIIRGERPDTEEIDEWKEAASTEDKQIIEVLESIMRKCWQQDPSDRPDMIKVRDQLQELRDQQSDADTLAEVVELLRVMSLSPPMAKEQRLVPLHQFSPISGKFIGGTNNDGEKSWRKVFSKREYISGFSEVSSLMCEQCEGIVYNIYNLPNVQQAAINCDEVEFEQNGSGNIVPGESPKKELKVDKAFKVRKASSTSGKADRSAGSTASVATRNNDRRSDENATDASSTSTVSSIHSRISFFETAAAVKPTQQPSSQQLSRLSLRRQHSDVKESSSSKVPVQGDDKATSTSENARPSTSSDTPGNHEPGKSPEKKPTLDEVFESQDPAGSPSNVRPAPGFLEKYKVSLKNQKYEEAKTMTTKITSMIEDNIDATAKDVRKFGIKLREKKLFLESIAIFDAAFTMFEKMGKTEDNLKLMRICVGEMVHTNIAMIGDDASMKVTVKNFIIPLMREKLRHIEDTSLVSEQFKCLQVCWILHCIEYSEYLVDEWEEREKTLRFALTRMKDVFKADDLKFEVYGHLLNNLGYVCSHTSRFEEAASFVKQAIDAFKAATDYSDEELRKKSIAQSENNLKLVQQKMK